MTFGEQVVWGAPDATEEHRRIEAFLARRNKGWRWFVQPPAGVAWASDKAEIYYAEPDNGRAWVHVGAPGGGRSVLLLSPDLLFDALQPFVLSVPADAPDLLERLGKTLDELGV